jgi:hypothetical protein
LQLERGWAPCAYPLHPPARAEPSVPPGRDGRRVSPGPVYDVPTIGRCEADDDPGGAPVIPGVEESRTGSGVVAGGRNCPPARDVLSASSPLDHGRELGDDGGIAT